MTIFNQFIPLLGSFLDGFGSWVLAFIALGVLCAIPSIVKEVVSYV